MPADPAPPKEAVNPGPTSTESDIGAVSQEDVDEQSQALRPRFLECVQVASGRLSCVGGRASLRMRLDREGAVRWVYMTDSTLGALEAERCALDVVRSRTWPRTENSFPVDALSSNSVR